MGRRNHKNDLEGIFQEIKIISDEVEQSSKSIYTNHELFFNDSAFRTVIEDIYTKVLGKYLKSALMVEPKYEEKIAGRIRADVQIDDKVTIEVKSHGLFGKKDLRERFEKIARAKPEMKHIYVAFRERNDLVEKTREILEPLGVSVFFLSIYTSGKNENATYSANDLESLIETTKGAVSR